MRTDRTDRKAPMRLLNPWRVVVALGMLLVPVLSASPAAAEATLSATVDDRPVAGSDDNRPIRLPTRRVPVTLDITNRNSTPITVNTVRFSGKVMGLTFFAYEASTDIRVAPGATESRRLTLDLGSLEGQATGLMPASIAVLDADREELASQDLIVDVRGSVRSVYGTFGLLLAVLTAIALVIALRALATHRLSPNRWARGLRFLVPGVGLGMVLVIICSMLRIFSPRISRWGPVMLLCAGGLFLFGYLTPTPGDDEPELVDDEDEGRAVSPGGQGRETLPPRPS